jgi:hypothetical protein
VGNRHLEGEAGAAVTVGAGAQRHGRPAMPKRRATSLDARICEHSKPPPQSPNVASLNDRLWKTHVRDVLDRPLLGVFIKFLSLIRKDYVVRTAQAGARTGASRGLTGEAP